MGEVRDVQEVALSSRCGEVGIVHQKVHFSSSGYHLPNALGNPGNQADGLEQQFHSALPPMRLTLRVIRGSDRRGPCALCKARDRTDRRVHALVGHPAPPVTLVHSVASTTRSIFQPSPCPCLGPQEGRSSRFGCVRGDSRAPRQNHRRPVWKRYGVHKSRTRLQVRIRPELRQLDPKREEQPRRHGWTTSRLPSYSADPGLSCVVHPFVHQVGPTLRIRRAVKRRLNPACWHILASYDTSACDVEHSYHGALGGIPRCDRLGGRKLFRPRSFQTNGPGNE